MSDNEEPLLVVKYVWWKVWFDVFVLSIGLLVAYFLSKIMLKDNNILFIIPFLLAIFVFFAIFEYLLTEEIVLFKNKIEKRWKYFNPRAIYFKDCYIQTASNSVFFGLIIILKREKKYVDFKNITIRVNSFSKEDQKKILEVLSDISKREVSELEGYSKLQPFIK